MATNESKEARALMREAGVYVEMFRMDIAECAAAIRETGDIIGAMTLEAHFPAPDDAYPFTAPALLVDCSACGGTGEVIEFPADDDERLVSCPRCGGTGETWK